MIPLSEPQHDAQCASERDQEPLCNCQQSLALEKRLEIYREAFGAIKLVLNSDRFQLEAARVNYIGSLVALAEASLARVK